MKWRYPAGSRPFLTLHAFPSRYLLLFTDWLSYGENSVSRSISREDYTPLHTGWPHGSQGRKQGGVIVERRGPAGFIECDSWLGILTVSSAQAKLSQCHMLLLGGWGQKSPEKTSKFLRTTDFPPNFTNSSACRTCNCPMVLVCHSRTISIYSSETLRNASEISTFIQASQYVDSVFYF